MWPCSGAIAAGVVATAIVGMMPEPVLPLRELLWAGMAAARYQLPLDRGLLRSAGSLLVPASIILAAEPARNRRGLIVAALLMESGL